MKKDKKIRYGQYFLIGLVGAVCIASTILIYWTLIGQEKEKQMQELKKEPLSEISLFKEILAKDLKQVESIEAFFNSSDSVTFNEFSTFANNLLEGNKGIRALSWAPNVPKVNRKKYEDYIRSLGYPKFTFIERDNFMNLIPVAERPEYFPVYYIEPMEGNEKAFGYDIKSNEDREAAIKKAAETGEIAISKRIHLVQDQGNRYGFLVFKAVYNDKEKGPDQSGNYLFNLKGVASGVFRIIDLFEAAVAKLDQSNRPDIYLFDHLEDGTYEFLYSNVFNQNTREEKEPRYEDVYSSKSVMSEIEVGDRVWVGVFNPTITPLAFEARLPGIIAFVIGILFSVLLLVYLISFVNRESRIKALIAERTKALEEEIEERKQIQDQRNLFFDMSLDLLCIAGFDGYFKRVNPVWEKTLGWTSEQLLSKPWIDFVHPEDKQSTIDAGSSLGDGNSVTSFENRYLCVDGTYRTLSWDAIPIPGSNTIFAVARDITEKEN